MKCGLKFKMLKDDVERIQTPKVILIGGGVLTETGEILHNLALSKPLIVTDQTLVKIGHASKLINILNGSGINSVIFDGTIPEPTDKCLAMGLNTFKLHKFDCVIGLGGGSCLDMAKAISAMSVNHGHVRKYKHPKQINKSGVPIILIPTTGGTGSELTKWCVISDTKLNEKYNLSGLALVATAAIIDWKLTLTTSRRITADTAIDSLTHAIEAFVSKKATLFSDQLALKAIPLIVKNIEKAFKYPKDPLARQALMRGASLAGLAFSNSSVALVHGMSRPIGANFHIPHGLSNSMLLAEVTNFSIDHAKERYAECAIAAGWANSTENKSMACQNLVENLRRLQTTLEVPRLADFVSKRSAFFNIIPIMVNQAMESGSPQNNPRVPTKKNLVTLYKSIW